MVLLLCQDVGCVHVIVRSDRHGSGEPDVAVRSRVDITGIAVRVGEQERADPRSFSGHHVAELMGARSGDRGADVDVHEQHRDFPVLDKPAARCRESALQRDNVARVAYGEGRHVRVADRSEDHIGPGLLHHNDAGVRHKRAAHAVEVFRHGGVLAVQFDFDLPAAVRDDRGQIELRAMFAAAGGIFLQEQIIQD